MRCLPDAPTKYNVEPPEQVSRVKKHPAMLRDPRALGRGAGRADRPRARRAITPLGARRVEPAGPAARSCRGSSGCRAGSRRPTLEPTDAGRARGLRQALEEARRRLRARLGRAAHRSAWRSAEGFAGTDVTAARTSSASSRWMKRQLAKPQKAPVDDEGKPDPRLRGPGARRRRGRSGRPVRRRGRSDPAAPDPAQARRPAHPRRRRDASASTSRSTRRRTAPRSRSRSSSRPCARPTTIRASAR